jgi:taurine dioxygenase
MEMSQNVDNAPDVTLHSGRPLRIRPTGSALGAEVQGVDLRALDADTFAAIHQAWLDHQVLLFRDQRLADDELVAFSRRFGDLDEAPVQETGRRFVEGHPEIYVVSNVVQDGVAIGSLGSGEAVWHTDMSYLPDPPKASVLYALEVPPAGGDTSFCSMYAAWDELPDRLRRRVDGLRVKHDGTYNSGGYLRQGVTPTDDPRTSPGTLHPLVFVHPESGRRALYLGRRRNAYIEGTSLDDSNALLDEIWSEATREPLTWRHQWRVGDLVLWDNRCTMHRRDAFDPAARRVMHRTQIKANRGLTTG